MQTIRSLMFHAAAAATALALACLTPRPAMAQTGMTQIKAGDLPVTLVYPTAAPNRPNSFGPFSLEVALGGAPVRGNGRLVVLSHGTGGSPLTDHDLARALAAAGFVVAQPQHRGDNFRDMSLSGPESWKLRPQEVGRTIDAVLADPRFGPLVDGKRVGVHGMSAGGLTGLAMAGGQWSVAGLVQHCAAHLDDDAGFCLYGARSPAEREQRAARYKSATLPPEASVLNGGAADARIASVAVTVPVGAIFTAQSLAAIKMPVGIVEATADKVLRPAIHSGRVLAQCGQCRALGAVQGAGHFDVLSPLPAVVASELGANASFDRNLLPASYGRVAAFFQQTLGSD
jgi:predicted dienelactone hydrolase